MAVNLAKNYQKDIAKKYTLGSLTKAAFGLKYDFIGAVTAVVYTWTSQALTDYTRSGANRYGTPAELQDTVQELTLSKDRAFSITVDKGNEMQQSGKKTAGIVIKMQMEEELFPEMDTRALAVISTAAGTAGHTATAAITATNAYEKFLDQMANLDDDKVPRSGRIAFVSPSYYKFIKLDDSFIKASELGMKMLINGQIGEIDDCKIVMVPSSYLPANTAFVITHPSAGAAPMQLESVKVHEDAPGISGTLVEGRFIYDMFIMTAKINACARHLIA